MSKELGVDKARWLSHVHLFMEITVEKGVLYIKLVNRPME